MFFFIILRVVGVSHYEFLVADVLPLVGPRLATIAAMVITAQVDTSATVLAMSVIVVEVAERWSA